MDLCAQASFKPGQANAVTGGAKPTICRLVPDIIRAQGQVTAFYHKVVLATTETAGTVNSMNYPLSSAERLQRPGTKRDERPTLHRPPAHRARYRVSSFSTLPDRRIQPTHRTGG